MSDDERAGKYDEVVLKETYEQYCRVEDELLEVEAAINDVETDTHPFDNHAGKITKEAFEVIEGFREKVTGKRLELKNENLAVLGEHDV